MKIFTARILPFTIAVSVFVLVLAGTMGIRTSAAERIKLSEVSHIHGIAVDPSDDPSRAPDGTVYALIVGLGLVSTPGSVINWSLLSSDVAQKIILHLAVDPTTPDRVFAVTQESEILTSTDGGRTWTPLS